MFYERESIWSFRPKALPEDFLTHTDIFFVERQRGHRHCGAGTTHMSSSCNQLIRFIGQQKEEPYRQIIWPQNQIVIVSQRWESLDSAEIYTLHANGVARVERSGCLNNDDQHFFFAAGIPPQGCTWQLEGFMVWVQMCQEHLVRKIFNASYSFEIVWGLDLNNSAVSSGQRANLFRFIRDEVRFENWVARSFACCASKI